MPKSHEILAKLLEKQSEERGFKADLRRKTGFSSSQLERYIEMTSCPSLDVLDRIAEALGTTPWELIKPPDTTVVQADPAKAKLLEIINNLDPDQSEGLLMIMQSALEWKTFFSKKKKPEKKPNDSK